MWPGITFHLKKSSDDFPIAAGTINVEYVADNEKLTVIAENNNAELFIVAGQAVAVFQMKTIVAHAEATGYNPKSLSVSLDLVTIEDGTISLDS